MAAFRPANRGWSVLADGEETWRSGSAPRPQGVDLLTCDSVRSTSAGTAKLVGRAYCRVTRRPVRGKNAPVG